MRSLHDRFWEKVTKGDACWEWNAFLDRAGYGRIHVLGESRLAHRIAWELENGPIPSGDGAGNEVFVCHRCDNPRCVRTEHLFLGTNKENMRDMASKKRANTRAANEAVAAMNRAKRHCKGGHEFTAENTYRYPGNSHRACRECHKLHDVKRRGN